MEPPKDIVLKDPKTWTIAGKPLPRLDTVAKVDGSQIYSMDFTMPGMLHAAITNCPIFGGSLKSFDASKIANKPGIKKVVAVDGMGVAVIADTWWRAKSALEQVDIVWNEGPHAKLTSADIAATLKEGLTAKEAFVGNKAGDVQAGLAQDAKTVEATYSFPYQHHATMEPMNSTALFTGTRGDVWTSSQNSEAALETGVEASGLPVLAVVRSAMIMCVNRC